MFQVSIYDPDGDDYHLSSERSNEIIKWANDNCKSFETHEELDMSDFSMYYDMLYIFYFNDEKDATWFKMRWS